MKRLCDVAGESEGGIEELLTIRNSNIFSHENMGKHL